MIVDTKVICCLPTFHGNLEGDPNKLTATLIDLLKQNKLPQEIFVKVMIQQLKPNCYMVAHFKTHQFRVTILKRNYLWFALYRIKSAEKKKFVVEAQPILM